MIIRLRHNSLLILCFFIFSSHLAQENSERIEASKLTVKTYFRLPTVTSNNFFSKTSRGISDIGLSVNYELLKGLNLGLGFKHSFFEISQFKITENLDAKTHIMGPYAELSYIKYVGGRLFVDIAIQGGSYSMSTSSNPCRSEGMESKKTRGNFISPNLSIYLVGPDRISYSFSVGYTITQSSITPETFCLENFSDFKQQDYIGNLQHINFGFGILVNIGKLNRVDTD